MAVRCSPLLPKPFDGGMFGIDSAPMLVAPKLPGQFVPLLSDDSRPLGVHAICAEAGA